MHASDSRGTPSAEPNVIPMIDILLVLLIIFMVNIEKRHVFELQLPQEAAEEVVAAIDVARGAGVHTIGVAPRDIEREP